MPLCSILIPSLRPERLKGCIESIDKATKLTYEILTDDEPGGIYKSVKKMLTKAKGDYIVHIPDDVYAVDGWLDNMIKFLDSKDGLFLGSFKSYSRKWASEEGENFVNGKRYSTFPVMRRSDIDMLGEFMDTEYSSFYGDVDLGLRVWKAGGEVAVCENAWLETENEEDDMHERSKGLYEKEDRGKFIKRWGGIEYN